jgi:heme exporter protein D
MIWNSVGEFVAMGGYGLYVWGSYAVVAVWMLVEPLMARRRHRKAWEEPQT